MSSAFTFQALASTTPSQHMHSQTVAVPFHSTSWQASPVVSPSISVAQLPESVLPKSQDAVASRTSQDGDYFGVVGGRTRSTELQTPLSAASARNMQVVAVSSPSLLLPTDDNSKKPEASCVTQSMQVADRQRESLLHAPTRGPQVACSATTANNSHWETSTPRATGEDREMSRAEPLPLGPKKSDYLDASWLSPPLHGAGSERVSLIAAPTQAPATVGRQPEASVVAPTPAPQATTLPQGIGDIHISKTDKLEAAFAAPPAQIADRRREALIATSAPSALGGLVSGSATLPRAASGTPADSLALKALPSQAMRGRSLSPKYLQRKLMANAVRTRSLSPFAQEASMTALSAVPQDIISDDEAL